MNDDSKVYIGSYAAFEKMKAAEAKATRKKRLNSIKHRSRAITDFDILVCTADDIIRNMVELIGELCDILLEMDKHND